MDAILSQRATEEKHGINKFKHRVQNQLKGKGYFSIQLRFSLRHKRIIEQLPLVTENNILNLQIIL